MQSFLQNQKINQANNPQSYNYSSSQVDDLLSFIEEIKKFPPIYFEETNKQLETLVPVCVVH